MAIFLYHFFHRKTNDKTEGGNISVPRYSTDRSGTSRRIRQRTSLFSPVILPKSRGNFFGEVLAQSHFEQDELVHQDLNVQELSDILQCGYGALDQHGNRRTVPSLGARYPIGVYVFLFEPLEGCPPGLYQYDAVQHRLDLLVRKVFSLYDRQIFSPSEWPLASRLLICLTISFPVATENYGSRGYRYGLFEAGHVAQNMLLAGMGMKKKLIPVEGICEEEIERTIGLNTSEERVLSAWCL